METQKINFKGIVVWVTIMHPTFEIDGIIYKSSKCICYYNFYEPSNNYYGKMLCSLRYLSPLICEDMNGAIFLVQNELTGFVDEMRC